MEAFNKDSACIAELHSNKMDQIRDHLGIWDAPRILHLTSHILTQTIGNLMIAGIVWFEEYGGMDQFKTVLNQLTGHVGLMLLTGGLSLSNAFILLMSHLDYGNIDKCDALFFISEIVIMFCVLAITSMIVLRQRIIFVWKRVHGFDDCFIARFISLAGLLVSVICGYISFVFGIHRGTLWFICAGPEALMVDSFRKPEDFSLIGLSILIAFTVHIAFAMRYFWYRMTTSYSKIQPPIIPSGMGHVNSASSAIGKLNARSLTDNVGIVGYCIITAIYIYVVFTAEKTGFLHPEWLLTVNGKAFFYFSLSLPGLMTNILVPTIMYTRNRELRTAVFREVLAIVS